MYVALSRYSGWKVKEYFFKDCQLDWVFFVTAFYNDFSENYFAYLLYQ